MGSRSRGMGLYRVLDAGQRADEIAAGLVEQGLIVRRYRGGRIAVAPALDQAQEAGERLARALVEIL